MNQHTPSLTLCLGACVVGDTLILPIIKLLIPLTARSQAGQSQANKGWAVMVIMIPAILRNTASVAESFGLNFMINILSLKWLAKERQI